MQIIMHCAQNNILLYHPQAMIHNIIHLSDIHIRNGDEVKSRYIEYTQQSTRLLESIAQQSSIQNNTAIIVITGDLFHYKNKIEPYALELAVKLLQGLANMAHVVIIRGNHDYRQDLPTERDMISALMSYNIPNVTYLDETGLYDVDNITIGMVAIQDTLLYGSTSGIASKLPSFPQTSSTNYKIALFHGSITGSTLQNGSSIGPTINGYPIEWFQGYDAILLGDIHVQQIKRATPIDFDEIPLPHTRLSQTFHYTDTSPWGYPGSLIQQDFGESLYGHGYIVWNLKDHLIHTYHLSNSCGFVKVRIQDTAIQILHRHPTTFLPLFVPVDKIIQESWFPQQLMLSVVGEHFDHKTISQLTAYFQSHAKTILTIKRPTEIIDDYLVDTPPSIENIGQINSVDVLIDYIQNALDTKKQSLPDIWKAWLKTPDLMFLRPDNLPDSILKKINEKTDKLRTIATTYHADFERVQSSSIQTGNIRLHYIEWNWILNYNQGNRFDFNSHNNQISILNAKNASGKSNFLEIICIALYGSGFPSRYNKNYSSGMICDKKPAGVMASTFISFSLNDTQYTLKRVLRSISDKRVISFFEVILTQDAVILHQGQNAISTWLDSNIGTLTAYLMSSMLSQNADSDFFSLAKPEQKLLLDQLLSLEHIQSLQTLLHESTKYYKYIIELIDTYQTGITQSNVPPGTAELLSSSKHDLTAISEERQTLLSKWNSLSERTLYNVKDINAVKQEYILLSSQIASLPSGSLSDLRSTVSQLDTSIAQLSRDVLPFHPFSDLYISSSGTCPIDQVHASHSVLDSHPYYRLRDSNGFSLYEDANVILHKKDGGDCVTDCHLLSQTIRDFDTWHAIQSKRFTGMSINSDEVSTAIHTCQDTIQYMSSIITVGSVALSTLKTERDTKRTEKDRLSDQRPNKPTKDNAWIASIKYNIKYQGSLAVIQDRYDHLLYTSLQIPICIRKIDLLVDKINEYTLYITQCDALPFNPQCDACAQQSWKVTFDTYTIELPTIQTALDDALTELSSYQSSHINAPFTYDDHAQYTTTLDTSLKTMKLYLASLKQYEIERVLHASYDIWKTSYDTVNASSDRLEKCYADSELQLKRNHTLLQNAELDLQKLSAVAERQSAYDAYRIEYERRLVERSELQLQLDRAWFHCLYAYRYAVAMYLRGVSVIRLRNTVERDSLRLHCEQLETKITLEKHAQHLEAIISAYPFWMAWKTVCDKETTLTLRVNELEVILRNGTVGDTNSSTLLLQQTKQYSGIVSSLADLFGGYRKWIYTTHIAPLIQLRMNRVLRMICDNLLFESEWLDAIDSLSWFIRDGTSRVVLEKSSGFQRFIVGIAMRMALRDIGFCRIQHSDLFIDEGFTACDTDHLEKVPSFLQGLLHFYKSIYLVTHLEDLKACSPHHIYIDRDETGLAHMRSTTTCSSDNSNTVAITVTVPAKKRGGRPPKQKV